MTDIKAIVAEKTDLLMRQLREQVATLATKNTVEFCAQASTLVTEIRDEISSLQQELLESQNRNPPKTLTIRHVKWRKDHDTGLIYPAADTDLFDQLLKLPRGTLTFTPADQDYGATRDPEPSKLHYPNSKDNCQHRYHGSSCVLCGDGA